MSPREVDLQASTFAVRTRAEGLFSKLAHDLEIAAEGFSGEASVEGERWQATLRFPVRSMRVVGVLRGDHVDRGVLSTKDRGDIQRRIHEEVLRSDEVVVEACGESYERGLATIRTGAGEQEVSLALTVDERRDGELVAEGKGYASLRALGLGTVKGPLGAFKVSDTIELVFWVMLGAPAPSE